MSLNQVLPGVPNKCRGSFIYRICYIDNVTYKFVAYKNELKIFDDDLKIVPIYIYIDNPDAYILHLSVCSKTGTVTFSDGCVVYQYVKVDKSKAEWTFEQKFTTDKKISQLEWNNKGSRLLVCTEKMLLLYSYKPRLHRLKLIWEKYTPNPVSNACFSPDGAYFATYSQDDCLVKLWYNTHSYLKTFCPIFNFRREIRNQIANIFTARQYSFIYLQHPEKVLGISWRKSSSFSIKARTTNFLMTNCADGICRIWSECLWSTYNSSHMAESVLQMQKNRTYDCDSKMFDSMTDLSSFISPVVNMKMIIALGKSHKDDCAANDKLTHLYEYMWYDNKYAETELYGACIFGGKPPEKLKPSSTTINWIDGNIQPFSLLDEETDQQEHQNESASLVLTQKSSAESSGIVDEWSKKAIRQWHNNVDLICGVCKFTGSFTVWSLENLDRSAERNFHSVSAHVIFSVSNAFHIPKSLGNSTINYISNICHGNSEVISLKDTLETNVNCFDPSYDHKSDNECTKQLLSLVKSTRTGNFSMHSNMAILQNTQISVVFSDGTITVYKLSYNDHIKFSHPSDITLVGILSGHSLNVQCIVTHSIFPSFITVSSKCSFTQLHQNPIINIENSALDKTAEPIITSELIVWRFQPLNTYKMISNVTEVGRITTTNAYQFRFVMWLPNVPSCRIATKNTDQFTQLFFISVDLTNNFSLYQVTFSNFLLYNKKIDKIKLEKSSDFLIDDSIHQISNINTDDALKGLYLIHVDCIIWDENQPIDSPGYYTFYIVCIGKQMKSTDHSLVLVVFSLSICESGYIQHDDFVSSKNFNKSFFISLNDSVSDAESTQRKSDSILTDKVKPIIVKINGHSVSSFEISIPIEEVEFKKIPSNSTKNILTAISIKKTYSNLMEILYVVCDGTGSYKFNAVVESTTFSNCKLLSSKSSTHDLDDNCKILASSFKDIHNFANISIGVDSNNKYSDFFSVNFYECGSNSKFQWINTSNLDIPLSDFRIDFRTLNNVNNVLIDSFCCVDVCWANRNLLVDILAVNINGQVAIFLPYPRDMSISNLCQGVKFKSWYLFTTIVISPVINALANSQLSWTNTAQLICSTNSCVSIMSLCDSTHDGLYLIDTVTDSNNQEKLTSLQSVSLLHNVIRLKSKLPTWHPLFLYGLVLLKKHELVIKILCDVVKYLKLSCDGVCNFEQSSSKNPLKNILADLKKETAHSILNQKSQIVFINLNGISSRFFDLLYNDTQSRLLSKKSSFSNITSTNTAMDNSSEKNNNFVFSFGMDPLPTLSTFDELSIDEDGVTVNYLLSEKDFFVMHLIHENMLKGNIKTNSISFDEFNILTSICYAYSYEKFYDSNLDCIAKSFLIKFRMKLYDTIYNKSNVSIPFNDSTTELSMLAYTSKNNAVLFESCLSMLLNCNMSLTWNNIKKFGFPFWIKDIDQLKSLVDIMAKGEFQQEKNPLDCCLYYLLMNKKSLIAPLFKSVGNIKLMTFFNNNFQDEYWKTAALKNAFHLLGSHRFVQAMAFFVVAGCYTDAIDICCTKMYDIQLAFLIARLCMTNLIMKMPFELDTSGDIPINSHENLNLLEYLYEKYIKNNLKVDTDYYMNALFGCWLQKKDIVISNLCGVKGNVEIFSALDIIDKLESMNCNLKPKFGSLIAQSLSKKKYETSDCNNKRKLTMEDLSLATIKMRYICANFMYYIGAPSLHYIVLCQMHDNLAKHKNIYGNLINSLQFSVENMKYRSLIEILEYELIFFAKKLIRKELKIQIDVSLLELLSKIFWSVDHAHLFVSSNTCSNLKNIKDSFDNINDIGIDQYRSYQYIYENRNIICQIIFNLLLYGINYNNLAQHVNSLLTKVCSSYSIISISADEYERTGANLSRTLINNFYCLSSLALNVANYYYNLTLEPISFIEFQCQEIATLLYKLAKCKTFDLTSPKTINLLSLLENMLVYVSKEIFELLGGGSTNSLLNLITQGYVTLYGYESEPGVICQWDCKEEDQVAFVQKFLNDLPNLTSTQQWNKKKIINSQIMFGLENFNRLLSSFVSVCTIATIVVNLFKKESEKLIICCEKLMVDAKMLKKTVGCLVKIIVGPNETNQQITVAHSSVSIKSIKSSGEDSPESSHLNILSKSTCPYATKLENDSTGDFFIDTIDSLLIYYPPQDNILSYLLSSGTKSSDLMSFDKKSDSISVDSCNDIDDDYHSEPNYKYSWDVIAYTLFLMLEISNRNINLTSSVFSKSYTDSSRVDTNKPENLFKKCEDIISMFKYKLVMKFRMAGGPPINFVNFDINNMRLKPSHVLLDDVDIERFIVSEKRWNSVIVQRVLLDPENTPFSRYSNCLNEKLLWYTLFIHYHPYIARYIVPLVLPNDPSAKNLYNYAMHADISSNTTTENPIFEQTDHTIAQIYSLKEPIVGLCANSLNKCIFAVGTINEIVELQLHFSTDSIFHQTIVNDTTNISNQISLSNSPRSLNLPYAKDFLENTSILLMDHSTMTVILKHDILKHSENVRHLVSHPKESYYFCLIGRCTLLLHQFGMPSYLERFKLWEGTEKIVQLKFTSSGHKFGVLDDTGRLSLYLFDNFSIFKPINIYQCHTKKGVDFTFLESASLFITIGDNPSVSDDSLTLSLWDSLMPRNLSNISNVKIDESDYSRIHYHRSEKFVIVGGKSGNIYLFDLHSKTFFCTAHNAHKGPIKLIAIDGDLMATSSLDNTIKVWRITHLSINPVAEFVHSCNDPKSIVTSLLIDSATIISCGSDGIINLHSLFDKDTTDLF